MDFHPTRRAWTTDQGARGPWEAVFRGNRRFGRGGTGRSVFPLRALVPQGVHGLLAAQKNLGYTSIVGSSCRLHDQSIHAGQASGAVAAVSLRHQVDPAGLPFQRQHLAEIWTGLLEMKAGAPLVIWPYADVDPYDQNFVAIQQLALRRLLPLKAVETSFRPDQPATSAWISAVVATVKEAGYKPPQIAVTRTEKRRNIARIVWNHIQSQPLPARKRQSKTDADGDGIPDTADPLPFTAGWKSWKRDPANDGLPDPLPAGAKVVRAINFTAKTGNTPAGFINDTGGRFNTKTGFGWQRDLTASTRLRAVDNNSLRSGFVFTRSHDVWECALPNGRYWIELSVGDADHEQFGQNVTLEGQPVHRDLTTASGFFAEKRLAVEIQDGKLTLEIGLKGSKTNTCINWLRILPNP